MSDKKSLVVMGNDFIEGIKMLSDALGTEFESDEEKKEFCDAIVMHIAGDEKSIVQKTVSIKEFIDFIKTKIDWFKKLKDDANKAENTLKNLEARLKDRVLFVLKNIEKQAGVKCVEFNGIKISYQGSGKKEPVIIDDEARIPFIYKRYSVTINGITKESVDNIETLFDDVKISSKPDTDALLKALKDGEEIAGAHIGEQSESIRITVSPGIK